MTILELRTSANISKRADRRKHNSLTAPDASGEPMPTDGEIVTPAVRRQNSQFLLVFDVDLAGLLGFRSINESIDKKLRRVMFMLLVAVAMACLSLMSGSQSLPYAGDSSEAQADTTSSQIDLAYVRPTQRTKINNYLFDAFGPYPIAGAVFDAGIDQFNNAPPEWNQGAEGYAMRFGSAYGIAIVATSTRYGLSEAFKEDALYYRCECGGVFPRLNHAVISTLTARRGKDGHRVFSVPALVGPYAGTMTATYAWYPNRYGAKDAFRAGNYGLLAFAGENIALEFFYSGPHSLLHRMHLNNAHGSPEPGPNH
jgi:hypothetical protein